MAFRPPTKPSRPHNMSFRPRIKAEYPKALVATPVSRNAADITKAASHNKTNAPILQLPGEIRNIIYRLAIYPDLEFLYIVRATFPFCAQTPILTLPLFDISQQLRAEALSFLCATKEFRILGIETAVPLFDNIGKAACDIKRLVLSLFVSHREAMDTKDIDAFFRILDQATSLRYFELEIGTYMKPYGCTREVVRSDWAFLERVSEFLERRPDVEFCWSAGACDPRAVREGSTNERNRDVIALLGEERMKGVRVGGGPVMW
ncbi:hypothetical protein CC86DRAFT_365801 [Ophiobolus disseminans]|uniref:F-box domain-containing protein n=1 Tax=Ophiobolus disseminans TaxID=1469910 RepID=A0A6A7AEZ8_9PLEO|nr:hypothetical protein CC86DRAFT_365801 [Ophiobolus disseminans]